MKRSSLNDHILVSIENYSVRSRSLAGQIEVQHEFLDYEFHVQSELRDEK